jgi:outer membrane protein
MNKKIFIAVFLLSLIAKPMFSKEQIGVVNFSTCISDSKYGKKEQTQLENIKKQWTTLIEESEKELKDVVSKLEDQEYLEGLSPEATDELKLKYQTLSSDMSKYQNQLYQILNQAQYFFIQKISSQISKACEELAKQKNLNLIVNKEACFYTKKALDITNSTLKVMDKNFERDEKISKEKEKEDKKISEKSEKSESKKISEKSEKSQDKKLSEKSENAEDKKTSEKNEKPQDKGISKNSQKSKKLRKKSKK